MVPTGLGSGAHLSRMTDAEWVGKGKKEGGVSMAAWGLAMETVRD